jgi:hypothetical protein
MSVNTVLKTLFPFISAAASLGGPLGTLAANAVGKALGLDKVDPVKVPQLLNQATEEQLQALTQAEQDFKVKMAALGFQDVEALTSIAEQDRNSARLREESVRDATPKVLAYMMMFIAAVVVGAVVFGHLAGLKDATSATLIGTVIGYVFSELKAVFSYYFGTSASSASKDGLISETMSTLSNGH